MITPPANHHHSPDQPLVIALYQDLLKNWNDRHASDYADLFLDDANIIGFDGSQANGKKDIHAHIEQVFRSHDTGTYISIVEEIRFISNEIALLRAVAGLVPPGQRDINPATNAIQTMIAQKQENRFRIAVFQNTPAAFHERPDLREQLTNELRSVLSRSA